MTQAGAAVSLPMRHAPISCTIIAMNERDRIGRAIESVRGLVDEVLVVDSGSTDGTQDLAASLGARVIAHPFAGFGPQKRFAEDQAAHDWILNLDADEWLCDELRTELVALLALPQPPGRSFRIRTRIVYPRRTVPAPFADFHNYVRLYNRRTTRFRDSLAHDEVPSTADVVQLRAAIFHKSYRSVAHILTKTIAYFALQQCEGKRLRGLVFCRMLGEFPVQFFKYYIVRRHVFGGWDGFVYAVTLAVARWLRVFILLGW